jgi:tetratricopeptide (TPR) repeat protein
VQAAEAGIEMRFRFLETLREYGAEQLSAREREELAGRHACYYLALAEEADRGLRGPEREAWSARLRAEHDNMRAALAWALAHQEAETALRLGGALAWFWCTEQYLSEGRYRLEASLGLPGASARTAPRALALRGLGWLAWHHSDFEAAHAVLRESIAICRELGDKVGLAHALTLLGWIEQESGRDLAVMRAAREESLALFREVGDLWGTARATHDLGRSACEEGDYETARRLHEEAAALFRAQGDPYSLAYPLIGLGHVAQRQGDYAAARRYFAECLAIRERYLSQSVAKANALGNLALADWCLGDWQAALARLEECVELRRTGGTPHAMASNLYSLGRAALCAGQPERAAGPLRESLLLFRKHGNRKGEAQALIALGRLAREQQRPRDAPPFLREGLALALAVTDPAAVATALDETASLLGDQNMAREWHQAARLLGAAQALRQIAAAPAPPPERARHEQQRAAVHAALGDAAFQAAWAAGQALTLEQAAAEAVQALEEEAGRPAGN